MYCSNSHYMQLSPHFLLAEFELDAPIPAAFVSLFQSLCVSILEVVRSQFGPIHITSGYRTHDSNQAAHGVPTSEHIATSTHCACDFTIVGVNMRDVFDWIRNNPDLKWGQLILEHGSNADIIHLSVNERMQRDALEGATANRTGYIRWPVAPPSDSHVPVSTVSDPTPSTTD